MEDFIRERLSKLNEEFPREVNDVLEEEELLNILKMEREVIDNRDRWNGSLSRDQSSAQNQKNKSENENSVKGRRNSTSGVNPANATGSHAHTEASGLLVGAKNKIRSFVAKYRAKLLILQFLITGVLLKIVIGHFMGYTSLEEGTWTYSLVLEFILFPIGFALGMVYLRKFTPQMMSAVPTQFTK